MTTSAVHKMGGTYYRVSIPNRFTQIEISKEISAGSFSITNNGTAVKLPGIFNVELKAKAMKIDDFKKLVPVGRISDMENILKRFDFLEFKPYMRYNDPFPNSILIKTWNAGKGYRIMFKHNYPQGDGENMIHGNSIFKYKTNDWKPPTEKENHWLHKYVTISSDGLYKERGGNGYLDMDLYLKIR